MHDTQETNLDLQESCASHAGPWCKPPKCAARTFKMWTRLQSSLSHSHIFTLALHKSLYDCDTSFSSFYYTPNACAHFCIEVVANNHVRPFYPRFVLILSTVSDRFTIKLAFSEKRAFTLAKSRPGDCSHLWKFNHVSLDQFLIAESSWRSYLLSFICWPI